MTILQADGATEATLHGPDHQSTPQAAALRGRASTAKRGKRRRKPNTRRPKNVNVARRRVPRTKLKSLTCQRAKDPCLQKESPEDPILHPFPLNIIHQLEGGPGSHCLSEGRGPTLGPTHPVGQDLEGGPGHFQDPEVFLGLEVGLSRIPDLSPILDHDLDPGQDQDPGTNLGLHQERGVHPDPQERGRPASLNCVQWPMCPRIFQTARSLLSPDSLQSWLLKLSL